MAVRHSGGTGAEAKVLKSRLKERHQVARGGSGLYLGIGRKAPTGGGAAPQREKLPLEQEGERMRRERKQSWLPVSPRRKIGGRYKEIDGRLYKEVNDYVYYFEEDDEEAIREVIYASCGIPPETDLGDIIQRLRRLCINKMGNRDEPLKIDLREKRERLLRDCKATLEKLRKAWIDPGDLIHINGICLPDEETLTGLYDGVSRDALRAINGLEAFIGTLKELDTLDVKRPGRPPADDDHFVKEVGSLYREHIGEPKSYIGGGFTSLVQTLLEIMDLPYQDPSRQIRAALKALKE